MALTNKGILQFFQIEKLELELGFLLFLLLSLNCTFRHCPRLFVPRWAFEINPVNVFVQR